MSKLKLVKPDDPAQVIRSFDLGPHLRSERLARIVELHETIASTNDRAVALAKAGAAHGTTVVALEQSAGRGQRGRTWHSPPGAGVYASFLLRPGLRPRYTPALTLVAGVAVHDTVQAFSPTPVGIKWPNDLLAAAPGPRYGKKVSGLLCEAAADVFAIQHAVIGVGINLSAVQRPDEVDRIATSLQELGADPVPSQEEVIAELALRVETRLAEAEEELSQVLDAWNARALGRGETVTLLQDEKRIEGQLAGVAADGALRLRVGGATESFYRGDLVLPGTPAAAGTKP